MYRKAKTEEAGNFIKFLGTAGARFVMIKQLRASGGIWVSYKKTNVLIDPGPGSLVRLASSRPKLDPGKLDAVILTHRHLDHANDVNVIIEAMTEGGFKKRGVLFSPEDALEEDPVVLKHTKVLVERIEVLEPLQTYKVGDFEFQASMRHMHPVLTYGLKFNIHRTSVSLLTDTKYFDGLIDFYKTDILIISVVFLEPRPQVQHLSFADVQALLRAIKPKKAILTHFGMTMLKAKPQDLALTLSQSLGIEVLAAYDGMKLSLDIT